MSILRQKLNPNQGSTFLALLYLYINWRKIVHIKIILLPAEEKQKQINSYNTVRAQDRVRNNDVSDSR